MVERDVGRDAVSPCGEVAVDPEERARAVDAPESFHGEILGSGGVADDAHDPGVYQALMVAKELLESFEVASDESLLQVHWLQVHRPLSVGSTQVSGARLQRSGVELTWIRGTKLVLAGKSN